MLHNEEEKKKQDKLMFYQGKHKLWEVSKLKFSTKNDLKKKLEWKNK